MVSLVSFYLLQMKYHQLIIQSKVALEISPNYIGAVSPKIFELGAEWMFDKLNDKKNVFNRSINFSAYGMFKYGISISAFL